MYIQKIKIKYIYIFCAYCFDDLEKNFSWVLGSNSTLTIFKLQLTLCTTTILEIAVIEIKIVPLNNGLIMSAGESGC